MAIKVHLQELKCREINIMADELSQIPQLS